MRSPLPSPRPTGALVVAAAVVLAGCGSSATTMDDGSLEASLSLGSPSALERLTDNDNGLEVRKWIVTDDNAAVGAALAGGSEIPVVDDETGRELRRNGLRLVRIDAAEVEALADTLGGPIFNISAWYGQTLAWLPLVQQTVPRGGQAVAVAGRVRRLDHGTLQLALRAWTMTTEDGPVVHMEMLPRHVPSRTPQLRTILTPDRGFRGETFDALRLELQLEEGYAYVLTCEAPQVDWRDPATGATSPASGPRATRAYGPGPMDGLGPDAAETTTIGERLLRSTGEPPTRGVLVFVPRIPARMYPRAAATAGVGRVER